MNGGTVILKDGDKERVYSLLTEMFFEDVVESGVNFDILCETFCSFTDHDRETNLSPIDKAVFAQAKETKDYIKYLNIFGSRALYRKLAQYKSSIPLVQLVSLLVGVAGTVLAAIGFSNDMSLSGKIGSCSCLFGFIVFGFVTFTSKLAKNIVTLLTFLSVNGILIYILAEYGPTPFFLTILVGFILLFIVGKTLTLIKSKIYSDIPPDIKSA